MRSREGLATLGVWLPLALTRLVQLLESQWGGKPQKTSDILAGFALPYMAEAAKKDEEQNEADNLLASFEALKKRFGENGKQ